MTQATELRNLPVSDESEEDSPLYRYSRGGVTYYTHCKDEYSRACGHLSAPHVDIFKDAGTTPIYKSNMHVEELINPHAAYLGLHLIKSLPLHIGKLSLQDNVTGFYDGYKGIKFVNVEYDIVSTAFGQRIFTMSSSGVVMEVPVVEVAVDYNRPKGVFVRVTHNSLGVAGKAAAKYASLTNHEQCTHTVLEAIAAQFVANNVELRHGNTSTAPAVPKFANTVDTKSASVVTYIPLAQLMRNRCVLDTTSNLMFILGEPKPDDKHPSCIGVQPEVLNKSTPTYFIGGLRYVSTDKNASVWIKTPPLDSDDVNTHSATELKADKDASKAEGIYFTHTIQPSGIVVEKHMTLEQACAKEFVFRTRDEALNPNPYREAKLLQAKHEFEKTKHSNELDKLERTKQNDTIKGRVEETTLLGRFFSALGQIVSWILKLVF